MKNIELTKNHKIKLLKMFKKLFPEHNIDDDLYIDNNGMINYLIKTKKDCYNCVEIHWFEFCMTHLINTLYWNDEYRDNPGYDVNLHVELTLSILNHKTHPVDYLYEEFKKLKS